MKKCVVLSAVLLSLGVSSCANKPERGREFTLSGRIVNVNGDPVKASVWWSLKPPGLSILKRLADCDKGGYFTTPKLKVGSYQIRFCVDESLTEHDTLQIALGSQSVLIQGRDLDLGTIVYDVDSIKNKHLPFDKSMATSPSKKPSSERDETKERIPVKLDSASGTLTIGADPEDAQGYLDPKTDTITIDFSKEKRKE